MHETGVRYLQSAATRYRALFLPVVAVWVSGCSHITVTSAWQGDAPRKQAFTKVLVVAVSSDDKQRCSFERVLASRIESESTTAIASCEVVTQKEPLTREVVERAVASQAADAVIATRLVDQKWNLEEGGSRDTRGSAGYKATDAGYATGYYGVYDVPVIYGDYQTSAASFTLKADVDITTKVWETRGPTVVYTLDTKAQDLESTDAALVTITAAIADRLRRDGLIR